MTRSEQASIAVPRRRSTLVTSVGKYTVVSLRGEHDIATRVALVAAIGRAMERNDADLLVDLSEVTFIDASTMGVLIGLRNQLRSCSRSLHLRAPSPAARRVLEVCGLTHLVHPTAPEVVLPRRAATVGIRVDNGP